MLRVSAPELLIILPITPTVSALKVTDFVFGMTAVSTLLPSGRVELVQFAALDQSVLPPPPVHVTDPN